MNFRSKLVAITGSALILASSITLGAAEDPIDTGNATVKINEVTGGALSVVVSDAPFGEMTYQLEDEEIDGALNIVVTDTRGTGAGWDFSLSATDFERDPSTTFSVSNLVLTTEGQVPNQTPDNDANPLDGITPTWSGAVSNAQKPVWSAEQGKGEGQYTLNMDADLTVPGGTYVGSYTSTVTVTIPAAP